MLEGVVIRNNAFNLDWSTILSFRTGLNAAKLIISIFDKVEKNEGKGLTFTSIYPFSCNVHFQVMFIRVLRLIGVLHLFQQYFSHITATAHIIHVFSWDSPVLGWSSEVSCPKTLPRKAQRIQWVSNPGSLHYKSNTLPLIHAEPLRVLKLVVFGFNTTLTAKVIPWPSVTRMCFLAFSTPLQTQLSFQSHRLIFSHVSAELRGENTPKRRFASTRYLPQILH